MHESRPPPFLGAEVQATEVNLGQPLTYTSPRHPVPAARARTRTPPGLRGAGPGCHLAARGSRRRSPQTWAGAEDIQLRPHSFSIASPAQKPSRTCPAPTLGQ